MKLQHGHTYRTRCGWVGRAKLYGTGAFGLYGEPIHVPGIGLGTRSEWWYNDLGMFAGEYTNPDFPMHIVEEVFDTARASLIESLRGIADRWHEPLAKAHMIALLEIVDELKKELETA